MNIDKLLSAVVVKLIKDEGLKEELGTVRAIKGKRRPEKMPNPCFSVHLLSAPKDPDTTVYNGTIDINFYHDNHPSGNANLEKMGPIGEKVVGLFHDNPLEIDDYLNFNLDVEEPLGPLWDSGKPEEHFLSIRVRFNLIKKEEK